MTFLMGPGARVLWASGFFFWGTNSRRNALPYEREPKTPSPASFETKTTPPPVHRRLGARRHAVGCDISLCSIRGDKVFSCRLRGKALDV